MTATEPTPGVQTMLGQSGACPEIPHNGRAWKIGHPTQRAKAALEELAAAKAVAEVRALKGVLPPDAYQEAFRELTAAVAAGEYRTWAPGWQRTVLAPANSHLFLLSLLRECHPDATEDDAKSLAAGEPELVQAALVRVVPGFFDLLVSGLPLPQSQRDAIRGKVVEALTRQPTPTPPTT